MRAAIVNGFASKRAGTGISEALRAPLARRF
jgi:hypothetical protein